MANWVWPSLTVYQLVVIDLASGAELSRGVVDAMAIKALMPTVAGRLLGAGYGRDWQLVAGKIDLGAKSMAVK